MAAKKRRKRAKKTSAKKRSAKRKKAKSKGKVPLTILKKRLAKLSRIVKSRGG